MTLTSIGALVAGIIVGIIALPLFAVLIRRMTREQEIHWTGIAVPLMELVGLLFGTAIASTAIGGYVLDEALWTWYVVGVGASFVPGALLIAYRFAMKNI